MTFIDALLGADRPVIMELKLQDAHGNDLFGGRPVSRIVADYEAAGAPCLSVVTGHWFGGSDELLREVAQMTSLPLLQKDFLTRPRQLAKSRELGASAVLLTAGLLPRSVLHSLVDQCLGLGLTPFIEVANAAEVDMVPPADGCVVAVNNKDIAEREQGAAHLERSLALLPAVEATGTSCPVSASGISDPDDAARLLDAGYRALLVGTALLRSASTSTWMSQLGALLAAPRHGRR
jgi:indole-3-glycerol phosphate synthase